MVTKAALLLGWLAGASSPTMAQDPESTSPAESQCSVDLNNPGIMKDIVSNALILGVKRPEADVQQFLTGAEIKYDTGHELLLAAAQHFAIGEANMAADVERFKHCNCKHDSATEGTAPDGDPSGGHAGRGNVAISAFAKDVTLHVVLHELGHAFMREFDVPVLGNEETMADAFATHYLTAYLPDRAVDVLEARVTSLMIEAREVAREHWAVTGEHDSDARRAFQIAALAVAADADKYSCVAECVAMSAEDIQEARDYGAEIHRSWRRTLAPLWMPNGQRSNEARIVCDPENEFADQLHAVGLVAELESILTRFDWHSQVIVRFAAGEGGASWSRSQRTVTVHSEYLQRFLAMRTP